MYRLYLEKYEPEAHQNKEQPHVKEWLYWKIFTKNLTQVLGIRAVTHVRSAICLKSAELACPYAYTWSHVLYEAVMDVQFQQP